MDTTLSKSQSILLLFTFLVLVTLFLQANSSLWRGHLEVDIWDFYNTIKIFYENRSFSKLENNEILPGSLLFFLLPATLCLKNFNYLLYLRNFIFINLFLLVIHIYLYKKNVGFFNLLVSLFIMLAYGPILFFRAELFVSLLVLLGIILYLKKEFYFSFFFFGLAIGTKLYPVFILPYLSLNFLFSKKKLKQSFFCLLSLLVGFLLPVVIFFLLGGDLEKLFYSLNYHSKKPISIESLPGVTLTGIHLLSNKKVPKLFGEYGLWGLKPQFLNLSPLLLNNLSFLPLLLFYLYLFYKKKIREELSIGVIFLIILISLVSSKNLHPQYLFWFISLFPLLKIKKSGKIDYLALSFLLVINNLLTQYIYPLSYTSFIQDFYQQGRHKEVFYFQVLRNFSLLILLVISFRDIFIKKTIE